MITSVEGFIISEVPFGETSKIVNIFTKEYGLIGVMCKGAKSIKSQNRATTLKFTYGKFMIYYKKDKLSLFSSADIINPLKNIKKDIITISYVSYIVELTNQVIKQSNEESIYEDFINTILKVEEGLDPLVLTNILELKYLDYLGVGFNIDACVTCGNKTNILTLSSDKGGFVCDACITNEKIVDKKVIQMLRMYYYVNIKSISSLKIDDSIKNEINLFLNNYYANYTGLYLNTKKFLNSLVK
ncbi:MAG: DNA repair protein RecO [Bacilli bacterium]